MASRGSCVIVRVQGSDPEEARSHGRPFSYCQDGFTTISASGVVMGEAVNVREGVSDLFIVTTATVLSPFLATPRGADVPALVRNATVDVLWEKESRYKDAQLVEGNIVANDDWHTCDFLGIFECVGVREAVLSLTREFKLGWSVGWPSEEAAKRTPPPPMHYERIGHDDATSFSSTNNASQNVLGFEWYALLRVRRSLHPDHSSTAQRTSHSSPPVPIGFSDSKSVMRGDRVSVIGSPFGFLSPMVFLNSVSAGVVSNVLYANGKDAALFLTDARYLPGVEGGAVVDEAGKLIGLMGPPLRRTEGGALALCPVLPVHTLLPSLLPFFHALQSNRDSARSYKDLTNNLQRELQPDPAKRIPASYPRSLPPLPRAVQQYKDALVVVKIGSSWASGILVSKHGHVLTNAHLFLPYVPGLAPAAPSVHAPKRSGSGDSSEAAALKGITHDGKNDDEEDREDVGGRRALSDEQIKDLSVSVRVNTPGKDDAADASDTWEWLPARTLYISHTHLDVALLQLSSSSSSSSSSFSSPLSSSSTTAPALSYLPYPLAPPLRLEHGRRVVVLGHGIFSPEHGLMPAATHGVVSNIVNIDGKVASIQSTALVHSGNSGGLLISEQGEFLGMVTCNARQKSGSIIPSLNFSIPAAALAPLLDYANGFDHAALEKLRRSRTDKFLAALWKLQLHPKPITSRSTPQGSSKFAQFMEKLKQQHDHTGLRSASVRSASHSHAGESHHESHAGLTVHSKL